jgi:CxxC-x17-CxxC domain-containing protein
MSDRPQRFNDFQSLGRAMGREQPPPRDEGERRPGLNPQRGAGGREMFDAVCATCGRATQVPFQPRPERPVYCQDCFRAQRAAGGEARRSDAQPRDRGPRPAPARPGGLPDGYLRGGYFDAEGNLRPELVVEQPREIAEALAGGRPELSAAALRRFFAKARRIERRLQTESGFAAARPTLLELKPFARDSVKRDVAPPLFEVFIGRNVDAVQTERDFLKGFLPHFQYVVAYFPRK